jgi:hypothetical protein
MGGLGLHHQEHDPTFNVIPETDPFKAYMPFLSWSYTHFFRYSFVTINARAPH